MPKNKSYIQIVYNDFDNRLRWYIQHDMISFSAFAEIADTLERCLSNAKNGLITEREAVIMMSETFILNSMR